MITKLDRDEFYKIKHITDLTSNIEVKAIVNGNNPGEIYVDNKEQPTAALIWIEGQEGFQIVGDAQSESFLSGLDEYINKYIEPKLKMRNITWVEIGVDPNAWGSAMHHIFNERSIFSDVQHVFSRLGSATPIEFQHNQDNEVIIHKIDYDLLVSGRFANHSFLEEKILHFWRSIECFSQHGIGYLAEINNNVVSLCFSAFVADQTHAIDIETLEEYRRKSYGTAVARAYVQECTQKGMIPYWDCSPDNIGSIGVAKTLGLCSSFDYRVFWYSFS